MSHRARRPFRTAALATLTLVAMLAGPTIALRSTPADAAARTSVSGVITQAYQYRDGTISVRGYAFDRDHRKKTTEVCLTVDGRCVRVIYPHYPSPAFDKRHHLVNGHRFHVYLKATRPGAPLVLRTHTARPIATLDRAWVNSPGHRVVSVARKYVGNTPYTYGGSSPRTGFDCSGYAMFSYRTAHVANLPHNSDSQRRAAHMRRIPQSAARPGDLVFYFSGGSAYHVAIYAGHDMQYSAADEREGIRYQRIRDRNIAFMTNWH